MAVKPRLRFTPKNVKYTAKPVDNESDSFHLLKKIKISKQLSPGKLRQKGRVSLLKRLILPLKPASEATAGFEHSLLENPR